MLPLVRLRVLVVEPAHSVTVGADVCMTPPKRLVLARSIEAFEA